MRDLIVITGQTATGKTRYALEMAHRVNGELINADSRQVYKYLDIVTGKDKKELDTSGINYHVFDVVDPKERFSSHEYVRLARAAINEIRARNKTPVIVGGTYLYIKHLLYGFDASAPPNPELRAEIEPLSVLELQQKLGTRPADINDSDWNNPRRLIRRIEIASSQVPQKATPEGHISRINEFIGFSHPNRESLVKAVTVRVEERLKNGAIEEVEQLLKKGYTAQDPGLLTIGYQQISSFLSGAISKEEAIQDWKNKEIQYAKRQLTFMKKDPNISWNP